MRLGVLAGGLSLLSIGHVLAAAREDDLAIAVEGRRAGRRIGEVGRTAGLDLAAVGLEHASGSARRQLEVGGEVVVVRHVRIARRTEPCGSTTAAATLYS